MLYESAYAGLFLGYTVAYSIHARRARAARCPPCLMRVTILGAGVIGVTTAYYMAVAGHDVTVLDRREGVARETSFANAGEVCPGCAAPWAAPGLVGKAIKWVFAKHSPLVFRPTLDPLMWRWVLDFFHNCSEDRFAENMARMVRLAEYSRQQLLALRQSTGIAYDHRSRGTLVVYRTQSSVESAAKDVERLRSNGVDFELLDRSGCVKVEPGLAHAQAVIAGGLRLPNDETGDCFMFTEALAQRAATMGVAFHFATNISGLCVEQEKVTSIQTDRGQFEADAIVVAMGCSSSRLLRHLGLRVPIYPVKGYSITLPVERSERAPESTLMDEIHKVAITRLGNRIRVGGLAELSGFSLELNERRRRTLEYSLNNLFPGAADLRHAAFWAGLRPTTPDGTPVIGNTRFQNLYLNSGHGTLGWTMACGSAKLTADLVSGVRTDIDAADLALARYG
jgi:D-amino-acid dehydrogenase